MALDSTENLMSPNEIYEYVKDNIDTEAKIITVYLTVRVMHKEKLLSKVGNKYKYKQKGTGLI